MRGRTLARAVGQLAAACAAHAALGPASLVLYDVSMLYFETDAGDGFREPGFSKERRLEPQITIGLLTDAAGFPLMVNAFEGDRAETTTMVPSIRAFMAAHRLPDVTIVADAGMVSVANQRAIEAEGLSFILGARIPEIPYVVAAWRRENPDTEIPDGHIFTQPWPASVSDKRRNQVIYYQYRADRARRTLRGIEEQIAKAEKAIAGKTEVKRNRFVKLTGGTRTVNRTLEAETRSLAGLEGYVTNLETCPDGTPITPEFVIDAYHRLFQIEKSFRMSKYDLQARPIYHRPRDSIEAHLSIVFAALAVGRLIEERTGWSIRKFVQTTRRYRTIEIQAGTHTITAADPIPTSFARRSAESTAPTHADPRLGYRRPEMTAPAGPSPIGRPNGSFPYSLTVNGYRSNTGSQSVSITPVNAACSQSLKSISCRTVCPMTLDETSTRQSSPTGSRQSMSPSTVEPHNSSPPSSESRSISSPSSQSATDSYSEPTKPSDLGPET